MDDVLRMYRAGYLAGLDTIRDKVVEMRDQMGDSFSLSVVNEVIWLIDDLVALEEE